MDCFFKYIVKEKVFKYDYTLHSKTNHYVFYVEVDVQLQLHDYNHLTMQ